MTQKIYGGWLYANKDEKKRLTQLGVKGPMNWTRDTGEITKALGKDGTISHCLCTESVLETLHREYGYLWESKYPHYEYVKSQGHEVRYPYNQFSEMTLEEVSNMYGQRVAKEFE